MDHEPMTEDWMETQSGAQFHPFASHMLNYSLDDMIWGCARETRYGGQYKQEIDFYSVAEHQCLMIDYMIENGYPLEQTRQAAIHDAPEGLIKDIVRSIKKQDVVYQTAEKRLWLHASARYGVEPVMFSAVKELDNRILVDERAQIMNKSGHSWVIDSLEPLGVKVKGWLPRVAALEYGFRLKGLGIKDV